MVSATARRGHPYLDFDGPIAFAHRGGGDAPENTLAAFTQAVDLGYQYLETDVHVTADGVVVAFHDDELSRTCHIAGRISELTWAAVSAARVGGSEPIPRLADLFDAWPDIRWNIDCKSDRAVEPLATEVQRHDALKRVCLASFSDRRIRRLRLRLGPTLCTAAATYELAALWSFGLGLGIPLVAQVPVRRGPVGVVTERFVRRAHRHRLPVHVWTIDDAVEMHRLLDLGVDGLMTNRPETLRSVLVERDEWRR